MKSKILGLDGLRGLGAVAIICQHFGYKDSGMGRIATMTFLMITGYLVVSSLHAARGKIEAGKTGIWAALGSFWGRRALRIAPAFYFVLILATAIELHVGYVSLWNGFGWYALFAQNFYVGLLQPFWLTMSHTWTLAVQQQFCLIAGFALLFVDQRYHRHLVWSILALSLAMTLGMQFQGMEWHAIRLLPPNAFIFIAAGGLLALRHGEFPSWMAKPAVQLAFVALMVVAACEPHPFEWLHIARDTNAGAVVMMVACGGLLATLVSNQDGGIARILEMTPFKRLGELSYGVYIVHVPVAWLVARPFGHVWRDYDLELYLNHSTVLFTLVLTFSLAFANLIRQGIELPILRLMEKTNPGIRISALARSRAA